jgi:phosphate acetyltransferase
MDVPGYDDALIITDAAVNIFPTLEDKVDIVQNAIDLAHALGRRAEVRVAILSAMETVNPKVPSTIEAAALCKMADRGQITGGAARRPAGAGQRHQPGGGADQEDRLAGRRARQHPGRARPRGRQHAGQEPELPGRTPTRGHRARRARADHPDQPRRFPGTRLASCAVAVLVAQARRDARRRRLA